MRRLVLLLSLALSLGGCEESVGDEVDAGITVKDGMSSKKDRSSKRKDGPAAKKDKGNPCAGVKCHANAKCDPKSPNKCKCNPGFQGDGKNCTPKATSRRAKVCKAWMDAKNKTVSGGWTPGPGQCDPGKLSQPALDSALRMTNMYRFVAGLPAVTMSASFNAKSQACAVMMKANGRISHNPSPSWKCYTADGALAAKKSNLSSGGDATRAVYRFMLDNGNATTMGHRRWILSNWTGPMGFGTTGKYTCMYVIIGMKSGKQWAAWPPAGEVPVDEVFDSTGWTFQSDAFSPSGVEVRSGGAVMPVQMIKLLPNYGSRYAISFRPDGWKTQAGKTYNVTITGSQTIKYSVKPVTCP